MLEWYTRIGRADRPVSFARHSAFGGSGLSDTGERIRKKIGSATVLARELRREGVRSKRGNPIDKGSVYKLLNNPVYIGMAVHKGTAHPGEQDAIIDQALWDKVHTILAESTRTRSAKTRAQTPALLKGLIFGPTGAAMSPTHTRKGNRLYRY